MNNEIVVVMAFYKGQKYFKEQIDSIRKQTKLPDKLIIVNDSPEDKKASNFLHKFNYGFLLNVEIIDNITNEGCTKAFYTGIQRAYKLGAKYIWISDQDDIWMLDKIELQYKVLRDGVDICNHYSQKLVNEIPSTINFANSAGHTLAFNAKSFKKGIKLLATPNYNISQIAMYDSILSFIPLIYNLKWETISKPLVLHRLYTLEHSYLNSEMHKSFRQEIANFYDGILAYSHMKNYIEQHSNIKISSKDIFKYYREHVNKYNLCDNQTKLKNYIFNILGQVILS